MLVLVGGAGTGAGQEAPFQDEALRQRLIASAEHVVLPERCGECHTSEFQVWETTKHATGFQTLHRSERAKAIYQKLGLRLIRRGTDESTPACLQCHYTPVLRNGSDLRAGAGVTCESCHGPAEEWIDVHNDYGVRESDFQQAARLETPEHQAQRIERAKAAGMRRPSELYEVAANCFGCHTVPNEVLVNRAGHSTGSDFELVELSQGVMRHNFLQSFKTGDGRTNAERPEAWKRVMYVVGRALDAEYSLRGVAEATVDDLYLGAMSDRTGAALDQLLEINDRIASPDVRTMLEIMDGAELTTNNRAALLDAADALGEATRRFIAANDGRRLASLDPLWNPEVAEQTRIDAAPPPTASDRAPEPAPAPVAAPADAEAVASSPPAPDATRATEVEAAAPAAPDPVVAAPAAATTRHPINRRPPWMAEPSHEYIKKVPCARCHNPQEKWWRGDPHSSTSKPFRANDPDNVAIARAYGLASGDMAKANQVCMWCHGTAVTINDRSVRPGVGCQKCHGPGVDYEKPHETNYAESVALGLTDLRDPAVRARTCLDCHYITDPGLIDAGHATGEDFDLAAGVAASKHWGRDFGGTAADLAPAALLASHRAEISARGPAPVRTTPVATRAGASSAGRSAAVAGVPSARPGASPDVATDGRPVAGQTGFTGSDLGAPAGAGGAATPGGEASATGVGELGAAPADASEDPPGESMEELLLRLKQRLESLCEQLGRTPPD